MRTLSVVAPAVLLAACGGGGASGTDPARANDSTPPTSSDITRPSVSIESPANNQEFDKSFTILVNAGDNTGVTRVEFEVSGESGTWVTSDSAPPYQQLWDISGSAVAHGRYIVEVHAYDAAGNSNMDSVVVFVDKDADDDGAPDAYEIACGSDPADPNDTASDVDRNEECDNTGVDRIVSVSIRPRIVRLQGATFSEPLRIEMKATGANVGETVVAQAWYAPEYMMPGGSFYHSTLELNDTMKDGDAEAGDHVFSVEMTPTDMLMPSNNTPLLGATNRTPYYFGLFDETGTRVSSRDTDLSTREQSLVVLDDSIPDVPVSVLTASKLGAIQYTGAVANMVYPSLSVSASDVGTLASNYFEKFDEVDALVVFVYDESVMGMTSRARSYSAYNDIEGICRETFDNRAAYGASTRLEVLGLMTTLGEATLHELGHRFGYFCEEPYGLGMINPGILPEPGGERRPIHIAVTTESGLGVMSQKGRYLKLRTDGYYDVVSALDGGNSDGRLFTSMIRHFAFGLPASEVRPIRYIDPDYQFGDLFSLVPEDSTLEWNLASHQAVYGERFRAGGKTDKTEWRLAYLVISKEPLNATEMTYFDLHARRIAGSEDGQGVVQAGIFEFGDYRSFESAMGGGMQMQNWVVPK